MLYHISRNGQTYGPYTIEDLQKYVASGNILPTDLAKSDDMADWVPVSQILGIAPAPPASVPPVAAYAPQAYPPQAAGAYPDAPDLSWGLVLLFAILTCSLFMFVWNLIVASWMKRVQPHGKAVFYYAVATVLFLIQLTFNTHARTHLQTIQPGFNWWVAYYQPHPFRALFTIAVWIIRLLARFTLRSELEEHFNTVEPIGLSLSGVMTFFFGGLYFQYHLNRINELKKLARYRGAPI